MLIIPEKVFKQAFKAGASFIVEFPIEDFLVLTTRNDSILNHVKNNHRSTSEYTKFFQEDIPHNAHKDRKLRSPILMPNVILHTQKSRILYHDGRHRAAACLEEGVLTIPVAIRFNSRFRVPFELLPNKIYGQQRGKIQKDKLTLLYRSWRDYCKKHNISDINQ